MEKEQEGQLAFVDLNINICNNRTELQQVSTERHCTHSNTPISYQIEK